MGRKRTEIKPLQGERLKQLLQEQKITAIELSRMLADNYSALSQQTISSIINGKAALTTERARDIISLFPLYRVEWLLGECDGAFKFDNSDKKYSCQMLDAGLDCLSRSLGYTIEPATPRPDFSADESDKMVEYMQYQAAKYDAGYNITKGGKTVNISVAELRELKRDVSLYIDFLLSKKMQKPDA